MTRRDFELIAGAIREANDDMKDYPGRIAGPPVSLEWRSGTVRRHTGGAHGGFRRGMWHKLCRWGAHQGDVMLYHGCDLVRGVACLSSQLFSCG